MSQATFCNKNKIDQWDSLIKWVGGPRVGDPIRNYPPYVRALSSIRNSRTQNVVTKDPLLPGTRGYNKENSSWKKEGFFFLLTVLRTEKDLKISPWREKVILKYPVNFTVAASFRFPAVVSQLSLHNLRRSAHLWTPPNAYHPLLDKAWQCAEFTGRNHKQTIIFHFPISQQIVTAKPIYQNASEHLDWHRLCLKGFLVFFCLFFLKRKRIEFVCFKQQTSEHMA